MKIQNPLSAFRAVAGSRSNKVQDKAGTGKKYIPAKCGTGNSGKALLTRSITLPGEPPPVLKSADLSKEDISVTLLSHWSGKSRQAIQSCCSPLEKVNGSSVVVIKKLLASGRQLHSCQIPGVLVMPGHNEQDDFPEKISALLTRAIEKDPDLGENLFNADGLMKTPILIAQGKPDVLSTDALEQISSSVSFYPYVDVQETSGRALLTLYIDDQKTKESAIVNGLRNGLSKAVRYADENLPDASGALIQQYLR